MTETRTSDRVIQQAADSVSYAFNTIDYAHHEIHGGSSYAAGTVTDLASGGTVHLMITTPDTTKWCHLLGGVVVESESTINWYENPTSPSGGGTITPVNRNRNSSTTAGASVVGTVGVLSGTAGSLLFGGAVGSGRGEGGEVRATGEWILKQNEDYILEVVNESTGASWTSVHFNWYEHTNKE